MSWIQSRNNTERKEEEFKPFSPLIILGEVRSLTDEMNELGAPPKDAA